MKVLSIIAFSFIVSLPIFSAPMYTVTDLGADTPYLINNNGVMAGVAQQIGEKGFFILENGTRTFVPAYNGGNWSSPSGINDNGDIVGRTQLTAGIQSDGFLRTDSSYSLLSSLPGEVGARAYGINNLGEMVGFSYANNGSKRVAVKWDANGNITSLGGEGFAHFNHAKSINDLGQITGDANLGSGVHAFLYENGVFTDLGVLAGDAYSYGLSINNSGTVVGESRDSSHEKHAFIWDGDSMEALGFLNGDTWSTAVKVNDLGEVVGQSGTGSSESSFYWKNGQMADLNDLIDDDNWDLFRVKDINNAGQMVGMGYHHGKLRGFILNPVAVPEPSTYLILVMGVALCLLKKKRKA